MQFTQVLVAINLAAAITIASATPQAPSFDDTMTKIKLAHPGISDDAAHNATAGFMDAVTQMQTDAGNTVSDRLMMSSISLWKSGNDEQTDHW